MILQIILLLVVVVVGLYIGYQALNKKKNYERCLDMVFLKLSIPIKESKEDREREMEAFAQGGDFKQYDGIMKQLYNSLHSIYNPSMSNKLFGQDYISLEYAVIENEIYFYVVCPSGLAPFVEKQLTSFYPDIFIEKVEDYNFFQENSKVVSTYVFTAKEPEHPILTYERMNVDPLNNITNSLSKLDDEEGAAVQILIRPVPDGWQEKGRELATEMMSPTKSSGGFKWWNPFALFSKFFRIMLHGTDELGGGDKPDESLRNTSIKEDQIKAIDEKNTSVGFETTIRVLVSSSTKRMADAHLGNILSSFAQYSAPDYNGFDVFKGLSQKNLLKDFIFRKFDRHPWLNLRKPKTILSSEELASLFHIPSIKFNKSPNIKWQNFKIAPPPKNLPKEGLHFGDNVYRGTKTEVKIKNEDRFRHFYVIGQTGTGKSSLLQVMIRHDLRNGNGLCVVDPHGSLVEDILPFIPRERADDVIYFNPADIERPMGLNLLEAETDAEKDLVALDAMQIMLKLFNEETFGPRIQDYFRNGVLTLMADPEGAAITDIVRLFTDDDFQRYKVGKVTNPVVKSFWTNQMAKTGAREKGEMVPYFAAKFGQFVTNTMMRNIIGQTKSAFDFFNVMQEGKILLMNLSKGETGDINSKLLGLIIVSKIQMAAMRRQRIEKKDRKDFFLYIDEFQNYITDSIESILSEARKYRLGLILAHQYIKQLEGEKGDSKVKDAVFGNVGSMFCYKIGAQDAEYMAKEFSPVFTESDLINIDKYKGVMKLSIDTQPSRPFSIVPLNAYIETGDPEVGEAIKQLSRLKYGRDVDFVNKEILRRIGAV